MGPYQPYKPVPQAATVPVPLQSYNPVSPPLKSGYSASSRPEDFGYDSAQVPLTGNHHHYHLHRLRLRDDDLKLKIRIRILRLVLRLAATCIAIGTATQEGITLVTYLRTRNYIEDGRGPWALKTELWTSILLFAASVLTVILGVIMVAAYLISIRAANKVNSWQTWFASIAEIGHVALWIGVAIGYRAGKNGHDLWGWACSPLADKIQPNFEGLVNFDKVCNRGESSWHLAIASAAVQILSVIIWYMVYQRRKTKKTLKEHDEFGT